MAALGALPGAAAASLSVSSATIVRDGATGGSRWRGTQYRFGASTTCVDTPDENGNNQTVSFNVTAPGTPGGYNAGFTARGENDCSGEQSNELVLENALNVNAPAANPTLPPRCGINVMLVLDKSGSIESSGATRKVRDAANPS
jgi:hypothetical protein